MTQGERLDFLVDRFKADSGAYRDLAVGDDETEKKRTLRALMNIRMPRPMDSETLRIQDEYLQAAAAERGVVSVEDIPVLGAKVPWGNVLSLWQGDITRLAADAIVNAANSAMLGCFVPMHNCIDNCIHTYAGVQLRADCARRMKELRARYGPDYQQPTAVPLLTDAYNLPAKKIVHVVGPIVEGPLTPALETALADCYRNTLDLCGENDLRTAAFCGISTGVFHFPPDRAAEIAVAAVTAWLTENGGKMDRVIFNVHSDRSRILYEKALGLDGGTV